jgi:hypothetical protein
VQLSDTSVVNFTVQLVEIVLGNILQWVLRRIYGVLFSLKCFDSYVDVSKGLNRWSCVCMKLADARVVAACRLVEVYRRFRGAFSPHLLAYEPPPSDYGDNKELRNVGRLLPDYTVQHPTTAIFIHAAVMTSNIAYTFTYFYVFQLRWSLVP